MNLLQHLSVRTKLSLLVAISSVGMVTVGLLSFWSMRDAAAESEYMVTVELGSLSALSEVRGGLGNMRRYEKDLFLNLADEAEVARYQKAWTQAVAGTVASLGQLRALVETAEQAEIDRMLEGIASYGQTVNAIHLGITRGEVNDPWAANKLMGSAKAGVRAADQGFATISVALKQRAEARTAENARTNTMLQGIKGVITVGVLLFSIWLGWLLSRRISAPLTQAARAMERMADGDLSVVVEAQGSDETAQVLLALQRMQRSLSQTVSQVRSATDSINTASSEIASGNQDLSARTEQTASNLEETAASMEQLTSTVRQSADSARQANQLAASASQIAVRGGQVVGQVVTTMDEINASSKKISDIIGVIDAIAFQTNILALNAAVEAARAGEQGRGFAVVAGEVRNLAQRSAEAAKEIKSLIGSSVNRVEAGSRLVAEAGQTMSEIVGSVQRVSDIIGEITAAAGEQSDGIGQVNVAVNQLDQMTQQNAALVEESAAAAESLKDQASRLAQVVQVFRLSA